MFAYKILSKMNVKRSILLFLLAVVLYGSLFFYQIPAHRLIAYGIPSFIAFILIVKSLGNCSIPKPLVVLGNISYSLYLTHTFVITTISKILFNQSMVPFSFIGIVAAIAITAIAICGAYVSWYLIEEKFTNVIKAKLM
jgi:peptidoglycan/LPS O-acetylase OafA/YrhL